MRRTVACIVLSMVCAGAAADEVVRLAIGEWAPYTSETDPNGKVLEKVVTEAFRLEGVQVKYSYLPWKRAYVSAQQGQFDGTFPWNRTEERERIFHVNTEPLIHDDYVFFHLKGHESDWATLGDLKRYSIGVTLGYKQADAYKQNGIQAQEVPSEEMNFKKILAGRIDAYQTSKTVGYYTIQSMFSAQDAARFTNHPKVVETSEYFILFSRQAPNGQALSLKFDAGLKKLKASGAYDRIISESRVAPAGEGGRASGRSGHRAVNR